MTIPEINRHMAYLNRDREDTGVRAPPVETEQHKKNLAGLLARALTPNAATRVSMITAAQGVPRGG